MPCLVYPYGHSQTIPNPYEHGRSRYHGLDSTRNLTADPGEIYIDVPDEEVQAMIHYAIIETIKDEYIKDKFEENKKDSITNAVFDTLSIFGLQEAHATCPSTTNPSYK